MRAIAISSTFGGSKPKGSGHAGQSQAWPAVPIESVRSLGGPPGITVDDYEFHGIQLCALEGRGEWSDRPRSN